MSETVYVVDDDEAVRKSLCWLLKSLGMKAEAYASAQQFLDAYPPGSPGCLVLDVRMPGMGGLEMQERLSELGIILPIIFISGHGDVPIAVRAMKGGAFEFLQKPFRDQELIDLVNRALEHDARQRLENARRRAVQARLSTLTEREHEVLVHILEGLSAKEVAKALGVSHRTVETHRVNIMQKMAVGSLVELAATVSPHLRRR